MFTTRKVVFSFYFFRHAKFSKFLILYSCTNYQSRVMTAETAAPQSLFHPAALLCACLLKQIVGPLLPYAVFSNRQHGTLRSHTSSSQHVTFPASRILFPPHLTTTQLLVLAVRPHVRRPHEEDSFLTRQLGFRLGNYSSAIF